MLDFRTNDRAYIIGKGYGRVSVVLPDGSFDVKIEGYGSMHFNPDGTMGQSPLKRVYYDDPVVVVPIKNERLWRAYVRLSRALFTELFQLDSAGELPEPEPEPESDA
jgi:hypothetical protein